MKINFKILNYEKDPKDTNQLDFIFSSSNDNFNIEKIDKFKAKILAGKIIPSIITSTSTSSIADLLSLQIYVRPK